MRIYVKIQAGARTDRYVAKNWKDVLRILPANAKKTRVGSKPAYVEVNVSLS